MPRKHNEPEDTNKKLMRPMLPQFHLEFEKRVKQEKQRVKNLVLDVLKISSTPQEEDAAADISKSARDLLKKTK